MTPSIIRDRRAYVAFIENFQKAATPESIALVKKIMQRAMHVYYCPICAISHESEFFSQQQLANHLFYEHEDEDLEYYLKRLEERKKEK